MRNCMAAALAALFCATTVTSRLVVYGPQELKDKFEYTGKREIFYSPDYRVQDTCLVRELRKHPLWPVHGKLPTHVNTMPL
jgi:hypothetical protein